MYSISLNSAYCSGLHYLLFPLALNEIEIEALSFSNDSRNITLSLPQGRQLSALFQKPSLVSPWAIHLTLINEQNQVVKGWLFKACMDDSSFRRLSRWVQRQRKQIT